MTSSTERLQQELLHGERDRLRITAMVWGVVFCMALAASVFRHELILERAVHPLPRWLFPLAAFGIALFPLVVLRVAPSIPSASRLSGPMMYLTTALEVSMPSILIVIVGIYFPAEQALSSPLFFAFPVLILLQALRLTPALPLFASGVIAVQCLAFALWLMPAEITPQTPFTVLRPFQVFRGGFILMTGAATAFLCAQIRDRVLSTIDAAEERNRIVGMFGRHVPPAVVDRLLEQTSLEPETRYVCVMFLDIRGFTTLSEGLPPDEVLQLLNTLFRPMIDIVSAHHGVIDKFLGDGFMAVFGAPVDTGQDRQNAVRCALSILASLDDGRARGILPADLRVGIGVHAGDAITGNLGSTEREEYTVIGDVVNVASRVEALTKTYGAQLLVTEAVFDAVDEPGDALGTVDIRGRAAPMGLVRLA